MAQFICLEMANKEEGDRGSLSQYLKFNLRSKALHFD